jgi:hypothetical protein
MLIGDALASAENGAVNPAAQSKTHPALRILIPLHDFQPKLQRLVTRGTEKAIPQCNTCCWQVPGQQPRDVQRGPGGKVFCSFGVSP